MARKSKNWPGICLEFEEWLRLNMKQQQTQNAEVLSSAEGHERKLRDLVPHKKVVAFIRNGDGAPQRLLSVRARLHAGHIGRF